MDRLLKLVADNAVVINGKRLFDQLYRHGILHINGLERILRADGNQAQIEQFAKDAIHYNANPEHLYAMLCDTLIAMDHADLVEQATPYAVPSIQTQPVTRQNVFIYALSATSHVEIGHHTGTNSPVLTLRSTNDTVCISGAQLMRLIVHSTAILQPGDGKFCTCAP